MIGNRDFLLCGAGAAGPALEGEAVRTGMRAAKGAVTQVRLNHGEFSLTVLGNVPPAGICGSGIVDLLAELYLNGWVDNRGKLMPEMSDKIVWQPDEEEYAVCYGPKLWFYETDIQEFLKAKAAASTMVQILLQQIGLTVDDVENFYMAGAFGIHIHKESAVAIGMYPDIPPGTYPSGRKHVSKRCRQTASEPKPDRKNPRPFVQDDVCAVRCGRELSARNGSRHSYSSYQFRSLPHNRSRPKAAHD